MVEQGTVGASGDLAPLAHLALGLMGEGQMWSARSGKWENASEVLSSHGLQPLNLAPKEGLALINGTQLITSIGTNCFAASINALFLTQPYTYTPGVEALVRARNLIICADGITALTLEALKGTVVAYREEIHKVYTHLWPQSNEARFTPGEQCWYLTCVNGVRAGAWS